MENIKKLYIDTHKEDAEPKDIQFENLGYFFDKKSRIGIQKKYIEYDLKVGFLYDFTYEDYNDTYTYYYVVLKREGNIYYIAEYYNKLYEYKETHLGDCWIKCDVKEELGIDIEEWKNAKIYDAQTLDMRLKVEEYVSELALVQYIKMNMPGIPKQGMYCYGKASLEANMEMQEPLEKLYKYENQPDMRKKVREYISELNEELNRCRSWLNDNCDKLGSVSFERMYGRINALQEVRNDLKGRLEELI